MVVVGRCATEAGSRTLLSLTYDQNWFAAVVKEVLKEPRAVLSQFPETHSNMPLHTCSLAEELGLI